MSTLHQLQPLAAVSAHPRPEASPLPDQEIQDAVLDMTRKRMRTQGYKLKSINGIHQRILTATQILGRPFWRWTEEDPFTLGDHYGHLALCSQRKYEGECKSFFTQATADKTIRDYVQQHTGVVLRQLWHADNMIPHLVEREMATFRRDFTLQEFDQLVLAGLVEPIVAAEERGSKSLAPLERDLAMVFLLAGAGLRPGEALSLKPHDFAPSPDRPEMGPYATVMVLGKAPRRGAKKPRTVPLLFPAITEILDAYLHEVRPRLAAGKPATDHLFLSERGTRLSLSSLDMRFQDALRRAGLQGRGLTPHCLRHTFASQMAVHDAPMGVVKELLGHAFLSTTQAYTHVPPEYTRKALRKLYTQILHGGRP